MCLVGYTPDNARLGGGGVKLHHVGERPVVVLSDCPAVGDPAGVVGDAGVRQRGFGRLYPAVRPAGPFHAAAAGPVRGGWRRRACSPELGIASEYKQ